MSSRLFEAGQRLWQALNQTCPTGGRPTPVQHVDGRAQASDQSVSVPRRAGRPAQTKYIGGNLPVRQHGCQAVRKPSCACASAAGYACRGGGWYPSDVELVQREGIFREKLSSRAPPGIASSMTA